MQNAEFAECTQQVLGKILVIFTTVVVLQKVRNQALDVNSENSKRRNKTRIDTICKDTQREMTFRREKI
jgi:Asp-tRNA(Asn)/Glu-tRNA(Gln) amidotransferase C subunit